MVIESVVLLDANGEARTELPFLSECTIRIRYRCSRPVHQPLFNLRFYLGNVGILEASMLIDGPGPSVADGSGIVECVLPRLPLTPKLYDIKLFVRSGEGIANLIEMRTVARVRVTDDGLDAVPLRGPMAVNHLRQGAPVYAPRMWRFFKDGELTDVVESKPEPPGEIPR
jgi:hypothetical protein